jgi:predicted nucleic acid-binding OB-fold protein
MLRNIRTSDHDTYAVEFNDQGEPVSVTLHRIEWLPSWPLSERMRRLIELARKQS